MMKNHNQIIKSIEEIESIIAEKCRHKTNKNVVDEIVDLEYLQHHSLVVI